MSIFNTPEQTAAQETSSEDIARYQLEESRKSGAHWFYWIAGLSLVTSIIGLAGGQWGFAISLGVTRVIDAIAHAAVTEGGINASVKVIAFVFDLMAIGVFVVFGYLASKGHIWAFVLGMVLYALDGLLSVLVGLWFGAAFHALALYYMFQGYRAASQLRGLDSQRQVAHVTAQ
jgi:hypothetical protein